MLPNPEIREVTIQDYLSIFRKRLKLIIGSFLIIPTATAIVLFNMQSIYRATVSILVEKSLPNVAKIQEFYLTETWETKFYETQFSILASRALTERVFEELKLKNDPAFKGLRDPVGVVHGKISVERVKSSSIVLLNVDDVDPMRASAIANTLAKIYIQQDIEMRNQATRQASVWLETQLVDLKKKVRESEEALNRYLQTNKIVSLPDVESKTQTLLESLKEQRSGLETQLAEALKRYKQRHPVVIALNAQVEDIDKKIEQETSSFLALQQKIVEYRVLKRETESNQELYVNLLTRSKEAVIAEKIEASPIRVVDLSKPPEVPFKPNRKKGIVASVFLSLIFSFGLVLFLEYLDSTIRTGEDVSLYLSLAFLGYIPSSGKDSKTDADRSIICYRMPQSPVAESFRAVRTSLLFASPEDKLLKTILLTSTIPEEGKSFNSTNLAIIFSQVNERVILIDMDMRKPKLHRMFNVDQKPGLSTYLTGKMDLDSVIKPTMVPNLSLITSGTVPPNPSELLSSAKIRTLVEELKGKFDRVIIDSPPILSASDCLLVASIVDGVIMVIKGAKTRLEIIVRAKTKILEAKGRIIGAIVNNIQPEKEDRYYYYHYYYSESGKAPKKP